MVFKIMCFKEISNLPIGFKVFSDHVFQSVFKIMCFKVFSNFPIGFKVFSNHVFQSVFKLCLSSVFKFPHRFQWLSNDLFQNFPYVSMASK